MSISTVQLQVLGDTGIQTCQSMSLGWSGGSQDQLQSRFNLYLMRVQDLGSATTAADPAIQTVPIGQTTLSDASFRWLRVVAGPGQYVINAVSTSPSPSLVFQPTTPFTISAGKDTSCVGYFSEGLAAPPSTQSAVTLNSNPGGPTPQRSSNTAIIAGATASGVLMLAILAGIAWYWLRRRRNAPIAVRRLSSAAVYSNSPARPKTNSLSSPMQPIPLVSMVPSSPISPSDRPGAYPRPLPAHPPSPPASSVTFRPPVTYAESTIPSEDSFAEERDALREEFLSSDGTTSAGGVRRGRPFSAVQSSVASDLGVGPDARSAAHERRPKPMTFAVSNPDNTVWEGPERHEPGSAWSQIPPRR